MTVSSERFVQEFGEVRSAGGVGPGGQNSDGCYAKSDTFHGDLLRAMESFSAIGDHRAVLLAVMSALKRRRHAKTLRMRHRFLLRRCLAQRHPSPRNRIEVALVVLMTTS